MTDNWSAYVGYNFMDFGTKNQQFGTSITDTNPVSPVTYTIPVNVATRLQAQEVMAGVNYRLNWLQ